MPYDKFEKYTVERELDKLLKNAQLSRMELSDVKYYVCEMIEELSNKVDSAYREGYAEGESEAICDADREAYNEGYQEGLEKGRLVEYDEELRI